MRKEHHKSGKSAQHLFNLYLRVEESKRLLGKPILDRFRVEFDHANFMQMNASSGWKTEDRMLDPTNSSQQTFRCRVGPVRPRRSENE